MLNLLNTHTLCIAHRGGASLAPENTLAAARKAQAACLGVVVDVDTGDLNQEHTYLTADELDAAVERMVDVVLAADFD